MEPCEESDRYIILEKPSQDNVDTTVDTNNDDIHQDTQGSGNQHLEKHSAVWTSSATLTLLKLYENKLQLLETPKKKTRIWAAISESLREYNIEVTPDQVRWKINALTNKYKQCIDNGQHDKFKYFKEMDSIYVQYHVDDDSYLITELEQHKKKNLKLHSSGNDNRLVHESKAMIELRKMRLANRIESDRSQGKINLEKQWLEYLRRQELQKHWKDEMFERNLMLRKHELELKKRELAFKESLEYKKSEILEKETEIIQVQKEKCDLLNLLFNK